MNKKRFLIFISLFLIVFSILAFYVLAGCCFYPDNFCKDDSDGITNAEECCGSDPCEPYIYDGGVADCDSTSCIMTGCCSDRCEVKQYQRCIPPNEFAFGDSDCSEIDACTSGCCVNLSTNTCSGPIPKKNCEAVFIPGVFGDDCTGPSGLCSYAQIPKGNITGNVYLVIEGGTAAHLAEVKIGGKTDFTDANGLYEIIDVNIGTYEITAYFQGWNPVSEEVVIIEDTVYKNLTLTMQTSRGTVQGNVRNSTDPIEGAYVFWAGGSVWDWTDSTGEYTLENVENDTQQITVYASGYDVKTELINVVAGEINWLNFILSLIPPVVERTCTVAGGSCCEFGYLCQGELITDVTTCIDGCCDAACYTVPNCINGALDSDLDGFIDNKQILDTDFSGAIPPMCSCGGVYYNTTHDVPPNEEKYGYCCNGVFDFDSPCLDPGYITGWINDTEGNWLDGVVVDAVRGSGITEMVPQRGYYWFSISPGVYTVTASKTGYITNVTENVIVESENTTGLNITLEIESVECTSIPVPIVEIYNIKGITTLNITWVQPCKTEIEAAGDSIDFFLSRDGNLIGTFNGDVNHTIDDGSDIGGLQWETNYEYNLTAITTSFGVNSANKTKYTGDTLCEGKDMDDELCLNGSFEYGVDNRTIRTKCDSSNQLLKDPPIEKCLMTKGPGSICIGPDELNITWCTETSVCKNLGISEDNVENIFGLYYGDYYPISNPEVNCTHNGTEQRYCYYDYSSTTIDNCLNCIQSGRCYDYNSSSACTADNCYYGSTDGGVCTWQRANYSDMGKGICYIDGYERTDYCKLCNKLNPIFENIGCTTEICNLLGSCFSDGASCVACSLTTECESYVNEEGCIGGTNFSISTTPTCNSSVEFVNSQDSCKLKKCKWLNNTAKCVKDADDDDVADCDPFDGPCKRDVTPPVTTITGKDVIIKDGVTLNFVSPDAVKSFYCVYNGTPCCPNETILNDAITLPNDDYPLIDFQKEVNISFYSVDVYKNVEKIKTETLFVDTRAPGITLEIKITNHSSIDTTSNLTMNISVDEYSTCDGEFIRGPDIGSLDKITDQEIIDWYEIIYDDLPDGYYVYNVTCEDRNDNVNTIDDFFIEIDRIHIIDEIYPSLITLAEDTVTLQINTTDQLYCKYKKEGAWENFNPLDGTAVPPGCDPGPGCKFVYSDTKTLTTGTYNLLVKCWEGPPVSPPASGQEDTTVAVDSTNLLFTIDLQAPETKVEYEYSTGNYEEIDENEYYNNPKIRFVCSDPGLGPPKEFGCKQDSIMYCIGASDCEPDNDYNGPATIFSGQSYPTGDYKLCYNSSDNGSNEETTKCNLTHIDKTKPGITISTPSNNSVTNQGTVTVSGGWQDISGINLIRIEWYNTTGGDRVVELPGITGIDHGTFNPPINLFYGRNTVKAIAEDNAKPSKNKNQTSITVYYDLIGPEITNAKIYNSTNRIDGDCFGCPDGEYGHNITFNVTVRDNQWTYNVTFVNVTVECLSTQLTECNSYGTNTYPMQNNSQEDYSSTIDAISESLGVGNYSATYYAEDALGNPSSYSLNFTISDTTPAEISIEIKKGGEVVNRTGYGDYDVYITSNEDLSSTPLPSLEYNFGGDTRQVLSITGSGTDWSGDLQIVEGETVYKDIEETATFSINAYDSHNTFSNNIVNGTTFTIDTKGPDAPTLYDPKNRNEIIYTNQSFVYITGSAYGDEPEANITLWKNTNDPSDPGDWNLADLVLANPAAVPVHVWSSPGDEAFSLYENKIRVNDPSGLFVLNTYFEFDSTRRYNKLFYYITQRRQHSGDYYNLTFSPALDRNPTPNPQDINIYDGSTNAPDGWFNFTLSLAEGNNHIYVRGVDEYGNKGVATAVFNVTRDIVDPSFGEEYPLNGAITNNGSTDIYIFVNGTGSPIDASNYNIDVSTVTGTDSLSLISGDKYKIEFTPSSDIPSGSYIVNVNVTDKAGNTNHTQWQFTVDTTPAEMNITIFKDGENVSTLGYGIYNVSINATEELDFISTLDFSFTNVGGSPVTKQVTQLNKVSGKYWTGIINISGEVGDYYRLDGQATFGIVANDSHGVVSSAADINQITSFWIDTTGPDAPTLYDPKNRNEIIYTNEDYVYISGKAYGDQTNLLMSIFRNNQTADYSDGVNVANTTSVDSTLIQEWVYGAGLISQINSNKLMIKDPNVFFREGRYFKFKSVNRYNFAYYNITDRVLHTGDYYNISCAPLIETGTNVEQDIEIYDSVSKGPDGWFDSVISLDKGNNYIYVMGVDEYGNDGVATEVFNVTRDIVNPSFKNENPSDGTVINEDSTDITIEISGTGSPIESYSIEVKAGSPVSGTDSLGLISGNEYIIEFIPSSDLASDDYKVNVSVTDKAGNTGYTSWNFTIDTTVPSTPIIKPDGAINNQTPKILLNFSAQENITLTNVTLVNETDPSWMLDLTKELNDSRVNSTFNYTLSTQLAEGTYKIEVKAKKLIDPDTNEYGNEGYWYQEFEVDLTKPIISAVPGSDLTKEDTETITVTADEEVKCRWDYSSTEYEDIDPLNELTKVSDYRYEAIVQLTAEGINSFYVACIDLATNKADIAEVSITKDTTIPSLSVSYPYNNLVVGDSSINVIGATEYGANITIYVNGVEAVSEFEVNDDQAVEISGDVFNISSITMYTDNTLVIKNRDALSKDISSNLPVGGFSIAPGSEENILMSTSGSYNLFMYGGAVTLNVDVLDEDTPFEREVILDKDTESHAVGNRIVIKAKDEVENEDTVTIYPVIWDTTAPELEIISPQNNSFVADASPEIKANFSDEHSNQINVSSILMTLNGGDASGLPGVYSTTSSNVSFTPSNLNEIEYVVRVSVDDIFGNTATKQIRFDVDYSVDFDNEVYYRYAGGNWVLLGNPMEYLNQADLDLEIHFNENTSIIFERPSGWTAINGSSFNYSGTFSEGLNEINITVEDKTGNKGNYSWNFTVDTILPEITVNDFAAETNSRLLTVTGTYKDINADSITITGDIESDIVIDELTGSDSDQDFSQNVLLTEQNGSKNIVVTIRDKASNTNSVSKSINLEYLGIITSPDSGDVYCGAINTITVSGTYHDLVSCEINVSSGDLYQTYDAAISAPYFAKEVDIYEGSNIIKAKVKDSAQVEIEESIEVIRDSVGPVVDNIILNYDNVNGKIGFIEYGYNNNLTVNFTVNDVHSVVSSVEVEFNCVSGGCGYTPNDISLTVTDSGDYSFSILQDSQTLDVGEYNFKIKTYEDCNNYDEHVEQFSVNDTTLAEISIEIKHGNNVVDMMSYETYDVNITSNEPLNNIESLNYSFAGKTKDVLSITGSGTDWTGILQISGNDYVNIDATATFSIEARDSQDTFSDNIIIGATFTIDTRGPNVPIIYEPDSALIYTGQSLVRVMGYGTDNELVDMKLWKNTQSDEYSDGNWNHVDTANTDPTTAAEVWSVGNYEEFLVLDEDTIKVKSFSGLFGNGKYMKFSSISGVFYKIDNVVESGSSGEFNYYDVTFYPALDDPDNFNTNQDISVYASDRCFDFTLSLDEGNNYVYVESIDSLGNGDIKSGVYEIVRDSNAPVFDQEHPLPGSTTNDVRTEVRVRINDDNLIDRSSIEFTVDSIDYDCGSSEISCEPSAGENEEYNVTYAPGDDLVEGEHNVLITAEDLTPIRGTDGWKFYVDPNVPTQPDIEVTNGVKFLEGTPYTWYINSTLLEIKINFPLDENISMKDIKLINSSNNKIDAIYSEDSEYEFTVTGFSETLGEDNYILNISAAKILGGGAESSVVNWLFRYIVIDETKPSLDFSVSEFTNSKDITITNIQATDTYLDKIEVVGVDIEEASKGVVSGTTHSVTLTSNDGGKIIRLKATDKAGNENQSQATITLDQTAPTVGILINGLDSNNHTNNSIIDVSCSCFDSGSGCAQDSIIYYKEENGQWNALPESRNVGSVINEEKRFIFKCSQSDNVGNQGNSSEKIAIVDKKGPVIEIIEPPYSRTNKTKPFFKIETDEAADCGIKYDVLGNEWEEELTTADNLEHWLTFSQALKFTHGQDYINSIEITCNDAWNTNKETVELVVDLADPEINAFSSTLGIEFKSDSSFKYYLALNDEQTVTKLRVETSEDVRCKYDSTATDYSQMQNNFAGEWSTAPETDWININVDNTKYKFNIACRDKVGWLTDTKTIEIEVNYTKPIVVIEPLPSGYINNSMPEISVRTIRNTSCSASSVLVGGEYIAWAYDNDDDEFKTDNAVMESGDNKFHRTNVVNMSSDEDEWVELDEGKEYNFTITCSDPEEMFESGSIEISFSTDYHVETIDITSPGYTLTNDANVIVAGSTEANSYVQIYINDEAKLFESYYTSDGSFSESLTLDEGINEIKVEVTDKAGNIDFETVNVNYVNIGPSVSMILPDNEGPFKTLDQIIAVLVDEGGGIDLDASYIELINLSDGASVSITKTTEEPNKLNYTVPELSNGNYEIRVTPIDDLGNIGSRDTHQFEINNAVPSITITSPVSDDIITEFRVLFNGTILTSQDISSLKLVLNDNVIVLSNDDKFSFEAREANGLKEGVNVFYITVNTTIGNYGESPATTFRIDTKGPNITLVNKWITTLKPNISVSTGEYANCTIEYVDVTGSHVQDLTPTVDHLSHSVELESSLAEFDIDISCEDEFEQITTETFTLILDTESPEIEDYGILNSYVISETDSSKEFLIVNDEVYRTNIEVTTSEQTICRYSSTAADFEAMENIISEIFSTTHLSDFINIIDNTKYKFNIACKDKAGWTTDTKTIELEVNYTKPITVIEPLPSGYINEAMPEISVRTSRDAECYASSVLVGGEYIAWAYDYAGIFKNFETEDALMNSSDNKLHRTNVVNMSSDDEAWIPLDENKEYRFTITCSDPEEMFEPGSVSIVFSTDYGVEEINITSVDYTETNNATIIVAGYAEADSYVQIYINGVAKLPEPYYIDDGIFDEQLTLDEGLNEIKVEVTDKAGNIDSKTVNVNYVNVGPSVSAILPSNDGPFRTLDEIIAVLVDNGGGIDLDASRITLTRLSDDAEISMTKATEEPNKLHYTTPELVDDDYEIKVVPVDYLGNIGGIDTQQFVINNAVPEIQITSIDNMEKTTDPAALFKGTISTPDEIISLNLVLNDDIIALPNDYLFETMQILQEGENIFYITVNTTAGNYGESPAYYIFLDTTGPLACVEIEGVIECNIGIQQEKKTRMMSTISSFYEDYNPYE